MDQYIGLDVSLKDTSISVRENGKRAGLNPEFKGATCYGTSWPPICYAEGLRLPRLDNSSAIASRRRRRSTQGGYRRATIHWTGLAGSCIMSALHTALNEYLAMRRALGHELCLTGYPHSQTAERYPEPPRACLESHA